jgi:hypothetical protein
VTDAARLAYFWDFRHFRGYPDFLPVFFVNQSSLHSLFSLVAQVGFPLFYGKFREKCRNFDRRSGTFVSRLEVAGKTL